MTTDGQAQDLIKLARAYTQTSVERMAAMIGALRMIDRNGIEGDIVECGVWKGGNIILARKVCPNRVCWLYDTFSGMTEPGEFDIKPKGVSAIDTWKRKVGLGMPWCAASLDEVKGSLRKTASLEESKLCFVAGDVCATLLDAENIPERIALLRLDTDWYESTKVELEVLYPLLSSGGVLIVDDYGHWQGAKKAVDEFFAGQNIALQRIDYTGVMMVKA